MSYVIKGRCPQGTNRWRTLKELGAYATKKAAQELTDKLNRCGFGQVEYRVFKEGETDD